MIRRGVVLHARPCSIEEDLVGTRGALVAAAVAVAVGTTACTGSDDTVKRAGAGTSTAAPSAHAAPEDVVQEDVGQVPVTADEGYADAVTTFGGAEQVAAAATADARVARIALADCRRWTEGTVDPRLPPLLTPELLARVVAEPDRATAGSVSSLLSDLPERDGNGYRLAAAATGGCEPGGPLHYVPGPVTVAVDRSSGEPRLALTGGFLMDVRLGDTLVGAGRDWVFTSRRSAGGWLLTDVESNAHVSWVPPSAG
jgi:hypothetical protein